MSRVSKAHRARELEEHKAWREKNREAVVKLQLELQSLRTELAASKSRVSELEAQVDGMAAHPDVRQKAIERAEAQKREAERVLAELRGE